MGFVIRFHARCFWSQGFIHSFTGKFWWHDQKPLGSWNSHGLTTSFETNLLFSRATCNLEKGACLLIIKPGASYFFHCFGGEIDGNHLRRPKIDQVIGRYVMSRRAMGHGKPDEGVQLKVIHWFLKEKNIYYGLLWWFLTYFCLTAIIFLGVGDVISTFIMWVQENPKSRSWFFLPSLWVLPSLKTKSSPMKVSMVSW